jgi:hypothetical protein
MNDGTFACITILLGLLVGFGISAFICLWEIATQLRRLADQFELPKEKK